MDLYTSIHENGSNVDKPGLIPSLTKQIGVLPNYDTLTEMITIPMIIN